MIVVFCTCPEAKAQELASAIVAERLVACVNIVPGLLSIYHWQGEVCQDPENLLIDAKPETFPSRLNVMSGGSPTRSYSLPPTVIFRRIHCLSAI